MTRRGVQGRACRERRGWDGCDPHRAGADWWPAGEAAHVYEARVIDRHTAAAAAVALGHAANPVSLLLLLCCWL